MTMQPDLCGSAVEKDHAFQLEGVSQMPNQGSSPGQHSVILVLQSRKKKGVKLALIE
jgi:hypothetical protein